MNYKVKTKNSGQWIISIKNEKKIIMNSLKLTDKNPNLKNYEFILKKNKIHGFTFCEIDFYEIRLNIKKFHKKQWGPISHM